MDRKPWKGNGPRRSFENRSERSDRMDRFDRFDRSDRGERSDRFDRFDRSDRAERGDRFERSDRSGRFNRFDRSDRFERGDRFGRGPGRPDRAPRGDRFDRRNDRGGRPDFGSRSGPRARAFETRRFAERSDFAKSGVVKLDADIADLFKSAEDVNQFLRLVLSAGELVRRPEAKAAEGVVTPADAATLFTESDLEDDEDASYGEAALVHADDELIETVEAEEADEKIDAAEDVPTASKSE